MITQHAEQATIRKQGDRGVTWRLDLPLTRPLSLNARQHWRVKAAGVAQLREGASWLAREARIPACGRIHVQLHYVPPDARRRDRDNLVATLKPVLDGLVDAGVVPDDTEVYVDWSPPIIDPPCKGEFVRRLYVVVRQVAAVGAAGAR